MNQSIKKKKIWIDLDNSPHVPFFKPIIRELKNRGYRVVLTARDCSQTCGLADLSKMTYKKIGRHLGKNKIAKILGLLIRSFAMISFILKEKPDFAVSHGSRSQILISKLFGIESILIYDYEYTQGLVIVSPDWFLTPEIVSPDEPNLKNSHFRSYPGIKEDVYVPEFKPDHCILKELNIDDKKLIVTIRPPATQAHYHNPQAEKLLKAVIDYIGQKQNVCMILMPRYEEQVNYVRKLWPELCRNGQIIIPDHVVDGLNLIWHSDFVISGGGTMNREAAALGVPVYSIFRGKIGAIDQYLANENRLTLIESVEDVRKKINLITRNKSIKANITKKASLDTIVNEIVKIIENKD